MRWIHLTPADFKKAAEETGLLIIPMGSLERHGEHLPFGTDAIVAEETVLRAAVIEPAVVFPVWPFGQVHEAGAYTGTINFPAELLIQMLKVLLSEAAANGFKKILIYNGHGGSGPMLDYLDMATMDGERAFSLYIIKGYWDLFTEEDNKEWNDILTPGGGGHAGESETSMLMDCAPGLTKMEYQKFEEPAGPFNRLKHLGGVHTAFKWYSDYPENVTGVPSWASPEKGAKLMDLSVRMLVRAIRAVKADAALPGIQKEFYKRKQTRGK